MVKNALTGFLAAAGTVLSWFPFLFVLVIIISNLLSVHAFTFDPLVLVEVFPVPMAGALLLAWAAFRAREYRVPLFTGAAALALTALFMQLLAPINKVAAGLIHLEGAARAGFGVLQAVYALALAVLCAAGILLLRRLYPKRRPETAVIGDKPPAVPDDETQPRP